MRDIFVSYASEDRQRAHTLVLALKRGGWDVFWDRTIPTGKTWRDVIGTELAQAKCIVVLWSRASVTSRWVAEEAEVAVERGVMVPVLIDPVRPPLGFQSFQAADLVNWNGDASVASVKSLLGDIAVCVGSKEGMVETTRTKLNVHASGAAEDGKDVLRDGHRHLLVSRPLSNWSKVAKFSPPLHWTSILVYGGFTALLLSEESSSDRPAGLMFLGNALVMLVGSGLSQFGLARISLVCRIGAVMQLAILIGMGLLPLGDWEIVVPINLGIAGAFWGLAILHGIRELGEARATVPSQ